MPGRTRAKTHSWREIMKYATRWLSFIFLLISALATGNVSAQDGKITVMNPRGIMPAIKRIPMAQRLDTLDGKTVYLVDMNYEGIRGTPVMKEMKTWFAENMPGVKAIYKLKAGNYISDDPELWKEIKEKGGDAVIMGVAG